MSKGFTFIYKANTRIFEISAKNNDFLLIGNSRTWGYGRTPDQGARKYITQNEEDWPLKQGNAVHCLYKSNYNILLFSQQDDPVALLLRWCCANVLHCSAGDVADRTILQITAAARVIPFQAECPFHSDKIQPGTGTAFLIDHIYLSGRGKTVVVPGRRQIVM